MSSLNRVELIGNVGRDPEIRRTQAGKPIANFTVATGEKWRDKNTGEKREVTDWHNVVVFAEGLCEVVEKYVRKGDKIYVDGKMKTRKWTDQQGVERYTTEVVIQAYGGTIILLGNRGGGGRPPAESADDYGTQRSEGNAGTAQGSGKPSRAQEFDDDIPF